jgi:hypothetical protein
VPGGVADDIGFGLDDEPLMTPSGVSPHDHLADQEPREGGRIDRQLRTGEPADIA